MPWTFDSLKPEDVIWMNLAFSLSYWVKEDVLLGLEPLCSSSRF